MMFRKIGICIFIFSLFVLPVSVMAHVDAIDPVFLTRTPLYNSLGMSGVGGYLGAESSYINPSVLAFEKNNLFEAVYGNTYSELMSSSLMASRIGKVLGGGVSLYYAYSRTKKIHETSDHDSDNHPNLISYFKNSYHGILFSYYRKVNDNWAVSLGTKYLHESIYDTDGNGFGLNIGFSSKLFSLWGGGVRLGGALYDLGGTRINWSTGKEDEIRTRYRIGCTAVKKLGMLTSKVTMDIDRRDGFSIGGAIGVPEYGLKLNLGSNTRENTIGINYKYRDFLLALSYMSNEIIGNSYVFGIGFDLTRKAKKPRFKHDYHEYFDEEDRQIPEELGEKDKMRPEDIIEDLRRQEERIFGDAEVNYDINFDSSILSAGTNIGLSIIFSEYKSERIKSVRIEIDGKWYELGREKANLPDIEMSSKLRSLYETSESNAFTGMITLPSEPGIYKMEIEMQTKLETYTSSEEVLVE